MEYVIVITLLLGVFHYLYESVFAPEIRMMIRYEIFELRDRLRAIESEHSEEEIDPAFAVLDEAIANVLQRLPYISLSVMIDLKNQLKSDASMQAQLRRDSEKINRSNIQELRRINNRLSSYAFLALAVNSGGWLLYAFFILIIPVLVLIVVGQIKSIKRKLSDNIGAKISMIKGHPSMFERAY